MWVLCIQRCALSFQPGADSSEQATFLFKSYLTVNAGPCRLLGCFILSGLNQQFRKDNLGSFNAIPVLLLVSEVSYGCDKSLPKPFWQGGGFSGGFQTVHTAATFWQM